MAGSIALWVSAFRLRTLPLALSSIILGNFLAFHSGFLRWDICILAIVTTVFLQVLSNLANDYGDSVHGADGIHREGPSRSVQSGAISRAAMKAAMVICSVLALLSGMSLICIAFSDNFMLILLFLVLGLASIAAAIKYTAGDNPYGYQGFGDIFVFIFFGLVGVCGSYFLQAQLWQWDLLLPASSSGFLAVGVLNVNNIRDIKSDKLSGKKSIPVRIGRDNAVVYHGFLLSASIVTAIAFTILNYNSAIQWIFLAVLPLLAINMRAVIINTTAASLDPFLKQLALSVLLFTILFGLGLIL
jgi:1,4-dihydroxy-2-naphthoate octaprenyltransferase